jgi:DNA-binding CsgD family transcriptional regulator
VQRQAEDALRRGDWDESRALFGKALALEESPEALDGLATSCRYLGALDESLAARERAYRLYRDRGDAVGTTIAAAWLGRDSALPRAETSVARSWFAVARRQMAKTDSALARGTLRYFEGQFALLGEFDAPKAGDLGAEAREAGRECGDLDLEMQGLSLQGLACVAEGRIAEGMAIIEEATAAVLGGELTSADVAGWICCHLIYACERVSDTRRAAEWCSTMRGFCERWDMPGMFGMCRAHLGSVLMHEGRWAEAETELLEASHVFAAGAPALGYEAAVRLCGLRLRQGRFDEVNAVADLIDGTPLGWLCLPSRASVALEQGDVTRASELLDRYNRMVTDRDRMARIDVLDLQTRVHLARGDLDEASRTVEVLDSVATEAGTERVLGIAALARGGVLAARELLDEARVALEDATELFARAGSPFDLGRARIALGEALTAVGDLDRARTELSLACGTLGELGAEAEARRAEDALARSYPQSKHGRWTLSERELDVLRLAAEGLSNGDIAGQLALSVHTVNRHMANIRTKLGAESKASVVARAAREGLI